MNEYQTNLFNELMTLVEGNEAFFFHDWEVEDTIFRNFSYRLASYTDFLEPSALECRGHMFEVDKDGGMVFLTFMKILLLWIWICHRLLKFRIRQMVP